MAETDLRTAARAFVHNPEECSFESLYRMIWETWHQENGKEELQGVIRELLVEICEGVMAIQSGKLGWTNQSGKFKNIVFMY